MTSPATRGGDKTCEPVWQTNHCLSFLVGCKNWFLKTGLLSADLMNGERGRVQVRHTSDLVPGLVAVLVLEVAREILNDEPVHHVGGL